MTERSFVTEVHMTLLRLGPTIEPKPRGPSSPTAGKMSPFADAGFVWLITPPGHFITSTAVSTGPRGDGSLSKCSKGLHDLGQVREEETAEPERTVGKRLWHVTQRHGTSPEKQQGLQGRNVNKLNMHTRGREMTSK